MKFTETKIFFDAIKKINKNAKIAYCDIDWTIYRNSLFLDLVDRLIMDWYINNNQINKYNKYKTAWKNRQINYETFLMYAVEIFETLIKKQKINVNVFKKYAKEIIKSNGKLVFTYTLNKLKELQKEWFTIIFISGSSIEMVQEFTKLYGFDIWLGSLTWVDSDWYLNWERVVIASSQAKLDIINNINYYIQPSYVISFGDTNWDYEMLLNSNYWYAINPTTELYAKIKNNHNISAIIERKDLIIEIPKDARNYIDII